MFEVKTEGKTVFDSYSEKFINIVYIKKYASNRLYKGQQNTIIIYNLFIIHKRKTVI